MKYLAKVFILYFDDTPAQLYYVDLRENVNIPRGGCSGVTLDKPT